MNKSNAKYEEIEEFSNYVKNFLRTFLYEGSQLVTSVNNLFEKLKNKNILQMLLENKKELDYLITIYDKINKDFKIFLNNRKAVEYSYSKWANYIVGAIEKYEKFLSENTVLNKLITYYNFLNNRTNSNYLVNVEEIKELLNLFNYIKENLEVGIFIGRNIGDIVILTLYNVGNTDNIKQNFQQFIDVNQKLRDVVFLLENYLKNLEKKASKEDMLNFLNLFNNFLLNLSQLLEQNKKIIWLELLNICKNRIIFVNQVFIKFVEQTKNKEFDLLEINIDKNFWRNPLKNNGNFFSLSKKKGNFLELLENVVYVYKKMDEIIKGLKKSYLEFESKKADLMKHIESIISANSSNLPSNQLEEIKKSIISIVEEIDFYGKILKKL